MSLHADRRAERQKTLVLSALKVFAKHGIDGASVADIADAAGVAKGSVYLYFDSKDALAGEVMRHVFSYDFSPGSPLLSQNPAPLQAILEFVREQQTRILDLGEGAPVILHMFGHIGKSEHDQIGRGISQFMRESIFGFHVLLDNAVGRGLLPKTCNTKTIAEQIVAATYGAIHQHISVSGTNTCAVEVITNILKGQGAKLA